MKRIQETEYLRVVMELNSALSRVAFLEERQEDSVPVELYDAKAAECEALKKEKAAISGQYEERLAHKDAEHTAFMYSLVESCRMNKTDFGDYIEHVLCEMRDGNTDYRSLLPNLVVLPQKNVTTKIA